MYPNANIDVEVRGQIPSSTRIPQSLLAKFPARGLAGANSAAPIAVLPLDVLYEIFLQVAEHPIRIERQALQWKDSWLAVTKVCRCWRKTALDAPRLWSTIRVDLKGNINLVRMFVERSKGVMLRVHFLGWRPRDWCVPPPGSERTFVSSIAAAAQLLSGETHRILEFSTGKLRPTELWSVLSPFISEAPQLQVLRIGPEGVSPTCTVRLPFGGHISSLRKLWLESRTTSWPSCKGLTSLVLHDQAAPTLAVLLSTLNHCPALQSFSLALTDSFLSDAGQGSQQLALVSLSQLEYLCLHLPHKDVEEVLRHVRFPTTMRVCIYLCGNYLSAPASLTEICPPLHGILSRVTNATVEIRSSRSVAIKSTDSNVHIEWKNDPDVWTSGFTAVVFPALTHLTISLVHDKLFPFIWGFILSRAPGLSTLQIDDNNALQEILLALSFPTIPGIGHTAPAPGPAELCPRLSTFLALRLVPHDTLRVLPLLESCFRGRAARGAFLDAFEVACLPSNEVLHCENTEWVLHALERVRRTVMGLHPE